MQRKLSRQRGFSLIELMVTMVLGLLITAAVLGVFLTSNRNYSQDERFARLQENGRFAIRFLAQDLSMAGFWGNLANPSAVAALGSDCLLSLDLSTAMGMVDGRTDSDPSDNFECITAANHEDATDVIFINRVHGVGKKAADLSAANNGTAFLVTNGNTGRLVLYDHSDSATAPGADELAWRYVPRIYYIKTTNSNGDAIPTLYRQTLNATPAFADEELIEGIENIQIQFGIDSDADGVPDTYVNAPTAAQLLQAVTARIHVLARSLSQDNQHVDTKWYNLGEIDYKPTSATDADNNLGTQKSANVYRRVYTATVVLRNVINLAALEK